MTSISTRRRIVAVLLLPFLMILAGCGKLHAEFEIQDVDTINVSYDFALDEEVATTGFNTAEAMCADLVDEISIAGEMAPDIESYEENSQFGCLITGVMTSDNFDSDLSLTEEDGEYRLSITGLEGAADDISSPGMDMSEFDFQMTFTFPGEIIESVGGEVDGSSVTYTSLEEFTAGVDIRADAGGFPWVIVIVVVLVLGFLFLLLLAAVAFFVVRARKNKGGGSGPSSGMPGGYGAAAAAAPPAAPQSPQWNGQGSAAPQQPGGQQWGQASPPPPAPQDGQQWGQASPPPPAPQGGQQWGQASPPPPAPQEGQPWAQPGQGQPNQGGQPWDHPGQGQQPPQNPGW
ncbi:MAG: LppM family (lipo)protein [Brachybacterium sp.]